MRSTKTLISIICMAILLSCAVWARRAAADNGSAISYHNGPVINGTIDVYVIYYGNWVALTGPDSADTQRIVNDFLQEIGGSPRFQINSTYSASNGSPSGGIIFGGAVNANTPHGVDLDVAAIQTIVSETINPNQLP